MTGGLLRLLHGWLGRLAKSGRTDGISAFSKNFKALADRCLFSCATQAMALHAVASTECGCTGLIRGRATKGIT